MTTGETIKWLREKAGMSQQALAEKMGVSSSQISQYERGFRTASKKHLLRFADALNAPVEILLAGQIDDAKEKIKNNLFSISDFQEKISHIGFVLKPADIDGFIIEDNKELITLSVDEIKQLDDMCNTYLKFLLSEKRAEIKSGST